jgi:hypothetical protein
MTVRRANLPWAGDHISNYVSGYENGNNQGKHGQQNSNIHLLFSDQMCLRRCVVPGWGLTARPASFALRRRSLHLTMASSGILKNKKKS